MSIHRNLIIRFLWIFFQKLAITGLPHCKGSSQNSFIFFYLGSDSFIIGKLDLFFSCTNFYKYCVLRVGVVFKGIDLLTRIDAAKILFPEGHCMFADLLEISYLSLNQFYTLDVVVKALADPAAINPNIFPIGRFHAHC